MEELKFTNDLLTGEETIDYQHKILISYINNVIHAHNFAENLDLVLEVTLDELVKYTIHHFGNEEEIMEKKAY